MDKEITTYKVVDLLADGTLTIGDGYRAKNEEMGSHGLPFARAGNINLGFHFEDADLLASENIHRAGEKISEPGDVVFTSKGTVGRFAFVRDDTPRFVYSPQLCYWRAKDTSRIEPRWLYYWMHGREFYLQYMGVKGQTDMADYVSLTDQRRMHITIPSLVEQRAIAAVLGALDDKIELNRRMNATLEAMARALFRSWFVDFDPVRTKMEGRTPYGMDADTAMLFPSAFDESLPGVVPQGWRIVEMQDCAEIVDCLHSKKPERRDSGKPLLQLSNIRDDGLIDMSDPFYISDADYRVWTSRIEARAGDCVITNVGRVGATAQIPEGLNAALGRNMTAIRCRPTHPFPTFLVECLLSSAMKEEITRKTDTGTILDALNVKNISKLQLCLPDKPLLSRYERTQRPLRARMEHNLRESATLAAIRDALLPKLLSGAVRVRDAARAVEAETELVGIGRSHV